jgi:hypothetical protein
MPREENRDGEASLTPRETAHLRARDRKRSTRMVVDNAGVKRILQAREKRAAARGTAGATNAPATGGSSKS